MSRKKDLDGYDGRRPMPRNSKGKPHGTWDPKRKRSTKMPPPGQSGKALATFDAKTFERLVWLSEAQSVPLAQIIRDACQAYVSIVYSRIDAVQIARLRTARLAGERLEATADLDSKVMAFLERRKA